ncbi:MAG: alkaline phosphatase [Tannerella sp.]|jgi:predicted AlkP superfamily pyrophosphatase or phosphodiesterase|nr:alkaline phosphatase [Tannerella sp.]
MKQFVKTVLIILFFHAATGMGFAERKAKHVIFIGLDGWGSYSFEKAEMPNIKKLAEDGAYTLRKRSVLPSSSAVNWASMFMGAGPELHGYTEWGSKTPELLSRVTGKNNIFPTVFQLFRDKYPDAETGCIYDWEGIKYLVDTLSLNYCEQSPDYNVVPEGLRDMAVRYITGKKPDFAAIIFDEPDHVGHGAGHDTPEYYATLTRLDGYVGKIIEAVKMAGFYDETIFIITSDHGGTGKGHGGKTMLEMETPFIISGKNVRKGLLFDESMMQFDIAATIACIFDLPQPQVWIGRPMIQVFK